MAGLLSLPVELVVSIVELAAWSEVDLNRSWVASLCLVCSTFRAAATGPLYDLVVIEHKNLKSIMHTASLDNTPFARTRAVTMTMFGMQFTPKDVFARAFANAEYFAGSVRELLALGEHGHCPAQCSMVFVTAEVATDEECTALRPLLAACTHLHILVQLDDEDDKPPPNLRLLLGPRTRWLIVDAMASQPYPPERVRNIIDMLLPVCERLLFRTLEICGDASNASVDGFCALLRSIALERKEMRIWLDASPRHDDWSIFEHDVDDARRGRALWAAGEQLYVP